LAWSTALNERVNDETELKTKTDKRKKFAKQAMRCVVASKCRVSTP